MKSGSYERTDWKPFPEALSRIASLSPVKLADTVADRKTRFMRFVKEIISESVEQGANPVVLIDSSNTATLWPWLTDREINTNKIKIAERDWMQVEWKGARIIRIRQGLAPSIVIDKLADLAITWPEDDRPKKKKIAVDLTISKPTAPGGGLYRLGNEPGSGCIPYFSVGRKMLHQEKRGVSCYRRMTLPGKRTAKIDGKFVPLEPQKNAAGIGILGLMEHPTFTGQWPSPNPIEIVVTLRQEQDDPDLLAEFVERLRYGYGHYQEWTSLPAPLFFERVVRDYISHFGIEDAESSESENADPDA
ncbi:MAG TPA: RNAseH domain-containing protein [Polyangium sp.]|nr:RNAseH domain-containing protein [Polyangium sp.]